MNFIYVYENKTMKPVEIVLRRVEEGSGKMMGEVNLRNIVRTYVICTVCTILKKKRKKEKKN
jgi:hypothetical protein